jgi:integrase
VLFQRRGLAIGPGPRRHAAGIEGVWSPRELRHTFVSLMSDSGVPVEEIARLADHTSSRTTEIVYRQPLRPVMEKGAQPWTS